MRDSVRFAAYSFFRCPNPRTGEGEVRTIEQVVAHVADLKRRFGFTTHKIKAGVFHPDYELEVYRAVAAAFPADSLRFDPNAVWSTEQAIRFGQAIEGLRKRYLEDPVYGLNGMRRTREMARVPLATNTVVVNFEQLAANVLSTVAGGPMRYENGAIRVPDGPGLGVKLDRDKLREYSELYRRLGGYPYDQDPGRPGWAPIIPNDRWADPHDTRPVPFPV